MIYTSFQQASQQYKDINAIDYFFAKEFLDVFSQQDNDILFHLFICLSQSVQNGHTCMPLAELANRRVGFESDYQGVVTYHGYQFPTLALLQQLILSVVDADCNEEHGVVYAHQCLYMRKNYIFEQELQHALKTRIEETIAIPEDAIKRTVEQLFPQTDNVDAHSNAVEIDWQKLAVANSVNKKLSVIAGGPGTGKTYTVTKLLAAVVDLSVTDLNITLVAPTGKAAQRLTESITAAVSGFRGQINDDILDSLPTQAKTIHRLLGVIPEQVNFKHHQDNLLNSDVVIIDEVSMVDLALMVRFFRALPPHTQVIMLGDADQLPSVALGNVLTDIAPRPHLGYSKENCLYLQETMQLSDVLAKQLPKGVISGNAQDSWDYIQQVKVDKGIVESSIAAPSAQQVTDLQLLPTEHSQWLAQAVTQYYRPILSAGNLSEAFALLSQYRILCATRVGEQGVEHLNQSIMEMLAPRVSTFNKFSNGNDVSLFHGLPIMINENHYGLSLYNGDIGIIWRNEAGHLVACFESDTSESDLAESNIPASKESGNTQYRQIMPTRLPQFEPVYAMTIHKTQGSEFGHVAMVLPNQTGNSLLSRELLYTGITRAKHELSICASAAVWHSGVEASVIRYSNLTL